MLACLCVSVYNLSSCWHEKCLRVSGCVDVRKETFACLSLQMVVQHSSVMKSFCSSFFFLFPLILSLSLLLLTAVLLRSRTCLALINVPGIRLALHLSFPLPSLLQLHPTFYPCHPRTHNTSGLQLQLIPEPSHTHTQHKHLDPSLFCAQHHSSFPSPLQPSQ